MKNKSKVMDVIKEFCKDLRMEMLTGSMTVCICSFLIGASLGSSSWSIFLLVFPILISVLFMGLIYQIAKYNTMADESLKRVGLIQEYNEVINDLIRSINNEFANREV